MNQFVRDLTSVLLYASFLAGCATVGQAPVTSLVTLNEKGPIAAGSATGSGKVGRSEAWVSSYSRPATRASAQR
jgi:hypothetical protein